MDRMVRSLLKQIAARIPITAAAAKMTADISHAFSILHPPFIDSSAPLDSGQSSRCFEKYNPAAGSMFSFRQEAYGVIYSFGTHLQALEAGYGRSADGNKPSALPRG
ncbi:hypothetical protein SDC9_139362 [bioreactor metagenome]|uniref:Uncharacterized protein n=1 Tax=bioreactor metagenome TaxID=1076179 RepID=A0A645DSC2_9ZZZZ